jgi:hypothetical protein
MAVSSRLRLAVFYSRRNTKAPETRGLTETGGVYKFIFTKYAVRLKVSELF